MNLSIKQLTAMVKMAFDIAKADGEATESEYQIISSELQAFGVTSDELKTMLEEVDTMKFFDACRILDDMDDEQKREVCACLGTIICADGKAVEEEVRLWQNICNWCSFPSMSLEEAIRIFKGEASPDPASNVTRKAFNGGYYEGPLKDGQYHGFGRMVWDSGDVYEGVFENGSRTGQGKYTWPSGSWYEGGFENGKMSGLVIYHYSNGDIYNGMWKNDDREGFGVYYYKSGDVEYGEYRAGKQAGSSIVHHADGSFSVYDFNGEGKVAATRNYKDLNIPLK